MSEKAVEAGKQVEKRAYGGVSLETRKRARKEGRGHREG